METLTLLWTFAPVVKTQLAVLILLLQLGVTLWCYTQMSRARVRAVKSGAISPEIYKAVGDDEPEDVRVYTRLVANQFESPVLFYALIITGLAIGVTSWLTIALALVYLAFRCLHAREMSGEHVVLRRRKLFIRSLQILMVMMIELAISTLFFAQV